MPSTEIPIIELSRYLEASTHNYASCIDCLPETRSIDGFDATLRFHHLRFDANGEPKFRDLAEILADHIIEYCFSARRKGNPSKPHEYSRLSREARRYLRKMGTSGEAGEILLYLLLEAVLKAPQMVAKMELKTNPKMELHGSDGIHMKWHDEDKVLDIYFGEAKLNSSISTALKSLAESIEKFRSDGLLEHEFGMVTSHYKHADVSMQKAVLEMLDRKAPGPDCRINHACLVGYNWNAYSKLANVPAKEIHSELSKYYSSDVPRIIQLLEKRLINPKLSRLRFEVFFLPFRTVQEFRDAFNSII